MTCHPHPSVTWRRVLSLTLAAALAGWLLAVPAAAQTPTTSDAAKKDQVALLINRTRIGDGTTPLARSTQLDTAAQAHSEDMARRDYLDHDAPDGSTPQQRAERAGYHVPPDSAWIVVEVISAISADPAGPVDWWFNQSPDVHGRVLRDPRWREIGVGYAQGGAYGNYWTVLVGCRPGVLPTVTVDGRSFTLTERCGPPAQAAELAPAPEVAGVTVPALNLSVHTVAARDIEVQWSGLATASPRDWFGVYRPTQPDTAYVDWDYVSCGKLSTTARPSGTCSPMLPLDLTPGAYEVRFFADNSYTRLATEGPLELAGGPLRSPLSDPAR